MSPIRLKFFFLLLGIFCLVSLQTTAQVPSLAAADQYVVTVETERGKENFTIIRDGRIEEQFYYVPVKPIVAYDTDKNGNKSPIFNLLSYQVPDEKKEKLVEGGILQTSMVMTVSEQTQKELLKKINRQFFKLGKINRLSPLPIKKSELAIYDLGGNLLDQAPPKSGVGPAFGTQHYPFMLRLKSLGADIMRELSQKNGGLPVLITYTYSGMTPKVGFEVEVDWDACYQHFSTDTNVGIEAIKNAIGGGVGLDITTLRENFESKGLIKITSLGDETVTSEQLDELMSPILNLITVELFQQIHCPDNIDPAAAKELKQPGEYADLAQAGVKAVKSLMGKAFFSAKVQVNFALKDVKIVKKGKFTYKFDRQTIMDRTGCFGGFIGIGEYDKKIQEKCFSVMPPGNWEAAYFMLPAVGDSETLGIADVSLTICPEETKDGKKWQQISGLPMQSAVFRENVWFDKNRKEISNILFPLKAIYAREGFEKNNYRFRIQTRINISGSRNSRTIEVENYSPMFDGSIPVAQPGNLVDIVSLDGNCLTFGTDEETVYAAFGIIQCGKKSKINFRIDEKNPEQIILVPAGTDATINSLKFASKKGLLGTWKYQNTPLRDVDPGMQIMFFDYDWVENQPDNDGILMGCPIK